MPELLPSSKINFSVYAKQHFKINHGWNGEGGWRGGFRMGNTCTPVADSCQYMAKPIQYCKVKINK